MSDALGAHSIELDVQMGRDSRIAMDRNSAISGGTDASDGFYDLDYTYEKATAGRNTLRKTTMVMPEGSTLTYEYLSTSSLHDADASRVTRVKVSTTAVASYAYNGVDQLVGTDLPQPDVMMLLYDPDPSNPMDGGINHGSSIHREHERGSVISRIRPRMKFTTSPSQHGVSNEA